MDIFHKLKSTVSNALPGNPLLREYEVYDQTASAGPEFLWKIFSARKKTTKQLASIWLLEKSSLDVYGKSNREIILDVFRKGVGNLTKIRHPKIISIIAPLEESRDSLVFSTEPVFSSLGNALFMRRNLPFEIQNSLDNFKLESTEIIYGISNIISAILFIHKDINSVHRNISPQSIIITKSGCWKLCGMEFLSNIEDNNSFKFSSIQSDSPAPLHPFLKFSAPESVLKNESTFESDMFSFGMVIYSAYNNGKSVIECGDNIFDYKNACLRLKNLDPNNFLMIPETIRKYCMLLINVNSQHRPDPYQITNLPYFENTAVRALQKMDSLYELDKYGKSEFYKCLPNLINGLTKRINLFKIAPLLLEEFNDSNMIPFVLRSLLLITDSISEDEFNEYILPKFAPVFQIKKPIQITLILLENLNILLKKFKKSDFNIHIYPIISSSLETDNPIVQDLCLKTLPEIGNVLEFSSLKSKIFPKLKIFYSSSSMQMKFKCLKCIGKLIENVDKWTFVEDLIPFFATIKTQDQSIIMAIYAIFRIASFHKRLGFSADEIAQKVLPCLLPLSVSTSLTLCQYRAFSRLINGLCVKLQHLHEMKLEQSGAKSDGIEMISIDETEGKEIDSSIQAMDDILSCYLKREENFGSEISNKLPSPEKMKALTLEEKLSATNSVNYLTNSTTRKELTMTPFNSNFTGNSSEQYRAKDLTSTLIERNLCSLKAANNTPGMNNFNNQNSFIDKMKNPKTNNNFQAINYLNSNNNYAKTQSLSQKDIEDFLS